LSSEEEQAMATGNVYRKFCEVSTCGFWDIWGDIHRQMLTAILCIPTKVMTTTL